MLLVYFSRTNNIERFVRGLQVKNAQKITDPNQVIEEYFWLITYTDQLGQVPLPVSQFLEKNHHFLRAVAASGNRNFGDGFAQSANLISEQYKVPIILKFELSGTKQERLNFKEQFLLKGGF